MLLMQRIRECQKNLDMMDFVPKHVMNLSEKMMMNNYQDCFVLGWYSPEGIENFLADIRQKRQLEWVSGDQKKQEYTHPSHHRKY
jgi:hypothetical protein